MADDPDLQNLDNLIGKGVKSIFSEGDRVEFQSTGDLIKAHNHINTVKAKRKRPRSGHIRMSCSI